MRYSGLIRTVVLLMILFLHVSATAPSGEITIVVTGLKSNKGTVLISLFDNEKSFPGDAKRAVGKSKVHISDKTARITFKGLRYGKYAAATLHDENNNLKMDYTLLGMPKEGYGFSNNVTGNFGPPSFKRAAFTLSGAQKITTVSLNYFPLSGK